MLRLAAPRTWRRWAGRASEVEEGRAFGVVELQRSGEGVEHLVGDATEVAALKALVVIDAHSGQGKVRYIGSSVFPPSAIVQAQWAARDRGLQRYVCEQPPYSMLARGIEADVLPTCQRYGMGVISWSPLSGGWLSGKWRKNADDLEPMSEARKRLTDRYDLSMPANQRKLDAADQLAQLAEEAGMSLIEMAIAFVINHPVVTAAVIGPRTMEQLDSQLPAAEIALSDDLLDRIVTPGTNLNPADGGWASPALAPAGRRR